MTKSTDSKPIALWLLACCAMVFVMALIGAITRLTESGLSITEWNPIMGALPPLRDADWNAAFYGYQQIPQYHLHPGMTLEEFKHIYFWEWLHRLWGRLIGLAFALPFLWFLARGKINRRLAVGLTAIFAIGALQGFIGWFMVQSGLSVRSSVSPYRLALHLGFALLIYCVMLWTALDLLGVERAKENNPCLRKQGWLTLTLLAITMVWGAFTAGLHAGEAYNTWPLMDGDVIPAAAFTILPKWRNVFENLALVQFIHRWLGPTTMIVILAWVWRGMKTATASQKRWLHSLGGMAFVQVVLGLTTLLTHANIVIATLHQAGAITLLSLLLINLWKLRPLR